ncbi:ubiquinol-cytochrome c reductase complex assembly factor 1 isoform X2 [Nelusetta ayraudi]|uniref:ubiquinol-cytochrome c reductase complex assembly factor 1 isoform X2 n=1 Tax=Nelusetta ayraudi TaxID=303726 RepID=UPI003F71228E
MIRRPLRSLLGLAAQAAAHPATPAGGGAAAWAPNLATRRPLHCRPQPVKNQLSVKSVGPISEPGLRPLLPARRQQQQRRWSSSSSVKEPQQQPPQQPPQQEEEEEVGGALTKVMEALGFTGPLKYSKWKIKIAGLRMYTCCVERINYEDFLDKCSLPDTLNSWFLVVQLHVWMCLVRMRQEGRAGKFMCRYIVYSMWEDVEQRSMILGVDAIHRKEAMKLMTEMFYAALFGYDEGLLSDDCVLAAALWRNLFNRECDDPQQLEMLVEYVRKQVQFIDSLNGEDLLLTGEVRWRPLLEENAQSILKVATPTYNDAGL